MFGRDRNHRDARDADELLSGIAAVGKAAVTVGVLSLVCVIAVLRCGVGVAIAAIDAASGDHQRGR